MKLFTVVKERKRTYHYADGSKLEFPDIARIAITSSGFHKLNSEHGEKFIVAPGWRYITLDMDDWSF